MNLSNDFAEKLAGLAMEPNAGNFHSLFDEWSTYFAKMDIGPGAQLSEFNAIMKARLQTGEMSVRAPVFFQG